MENTEKWSPIKKLTKDLMDAMEVTSISEARFLVDNYYIMQNDRIRAYGQGREMQKTEEPHLIIKYLAGQSEALEEQIKKALDRYTDGHPIGVWLKSHCGIGPVISAGLISNLDITKAPTAGHFWSYAGLCPEQKRVKGQKVNWNPAVKRILWLMGESFVKVSGKEDAFYGHLYKKRKEYEQAKNEAGDYKEQALAKAPLVGKDTDAYKSYSVGKLPPAHIHRRCCRYVTKMVLSHLQEVWYWHEYGEAPPAPYVMVHLGHAHKIGIPNKPSWVKK